MDKYIGRLLDNRYEILEVIGTGGMAVVYKARCHRLNRLVAIKILKDDYLEDEEFRRRFDSESQAVAMLSHPNIVSIYDVSTSLAADYIVMELIDGITLKQYMEKKGVLNWKETLHFAIQIAKALEHAHSRGIVHRDIKPHNVMVLKNGSVKVMDFGIARMMSKGNTLTKEALGSVHYISPEQAKGGRVDNRSDIYSLGVVMYEMMSGRPPYDGESPVAVAIQHINGGAVMPSTLNPNIPGGLEQIIMKAMAHETSERYNTATQMLADMDEFRKDPAILFDYNAPPLEAVTTMPPPLVLETPKPTTAERVAQASQQVHRPTAPQRRRPAGASGREHPRQPERTRQPERPRQTESRRDAEEKHSNVATIAIVACSLAMVVAVVVFLVLLLNGGTGSKPQLVEVPDLVGKVYENLPDYMDFDIRIDKQVHDDTYEAGVIIDQNPKAGENVEKNNAIFVVISKGPLVEVVKMPDLIEVEQAEAERTLHNLSLKLQLVPVETYHETIAEGKVVRTEPAADTELAVGQTVTLYISQGKEVKNSTMPMVVGYSEEDARRILDSQNLDLDVGIKEENDSEVPEGKVIRSDPETGKALTTGQKVTLYISKGPKLVVMKDLVGLKKDRAESTLILDEFENYSFEYVESDEPKDTVLELKVDGKVIKPGDKVAIDAEIIVYVAKEREIKKVEQTIKVPTQADLEEAGILETEYTDAEGKVRLVLTLKLGDTVCYTSQDLDFTTATVTVSLEGTGKQTYELFVNDKAYSKIEVDFTKA